MMTKDEETKGQVNWAKRVDEDLERKEKNERTKKSKRGSTTRKRDLEWRGEKRREKRDGEREDL